MNPRSELGLQHNIGHNGATFVSLEEHVYGRVHPVTTLLLNGRISDNPRGLAVDLAVDNQLFKWQVTRSGYEVISSGQATGMNGLCPQMDVEKLSLQNLLNVLSQCG